MDKFPAPLTTKLVSQIKDAFAPFRPDVRSSHRAEAIARGLGFNTNASLLARLKAADSAADESTEFNHDACSRRLAELGYPPLTAPQANAIVFNVTAINTPQQSPAGSEFRQKTSVMTPLKFNREGIVHFRDEGHYLARPGTLRYSVEDPPEYRPPGPNVQLPEHLQLRTVMRPLDDPSPAEVEDFLRAVDTGQVGGRASVTQANITLLARHLGAMMKAAPARKNDHGSSDAQPNQILRAVLTQGGDVGSMPVGPIDMARLSAGQREDAFLFVTRRERETPIGPVTVVQMKTRPEGGKIFNIQDARSPFLNPSPDALDDAGNDDSDEPPHPRSR